MSGSSEATSATRWRLRPLLEPATSDGGRSGSHRGDVDGRPQQREVVLDVLPVAAVACLALPQLIHHARYADPQVGLYALLSVLLVAPLTVRRRFPLSVLTVVCVLMLTQAGLGLQLIAGASLLVAVYTVASRHPMRVTAPAGVAAVAAASPVAAQVAHGFRWTEVVVIVTAFVLAALMCGAYVRNRAHTIAALTEAADRLAREQAQNAQAAVARERTMIAREMHDIIAHSLSVMVTLADAAALKVATSPQQATDTMERVSEVGRQALGDSRRVLGILHGDATGPLTPQPGVADLAALVRQVEHDGLEAHLTVDGLPDAVPAAAGLTAYRIAQEATTNALRHAPDATRLDISVTITRTLLTLDVHDNGRARTASVATDSGGHGVSGMRERATAYGGTVTAGPAPCGGWRVLAELPLTDRFHPGEEHT